MKKFLSTGLLIFVCIYSFASDGNNLNFIYAVDWQMEAQIPTLKKDGGGYDFKTETIHRSFYLFGTPLGYLRINKNDKDSEGSDGKNLSFVWLQPFAFRAYYDSLGKKMMLMPEDPTEQPFFLEDFLGIHMDPKAYFAAKKLFAPNIEFSEKDGIVEAILPNYIVTVMRKEGVTFVKIAQREKDSSYTYTISGDSDGVIKIDSGFKTSPSGVLRPISAKDFDFSLASQPLLNGEFIVADFRVVPTPRDPAVSYIYAGTIPSIEDTEKMADLKTVKEWNKEVQDFYFDSLEETPTTFEGLPEIMEYLKAHESKPGN